MSPCVGICAYASTTVPCMYECVCVQQKVMVESLISQINSFIFVITNTVHNSCFIILSLVIFIPMQTKYTCAHT